MTPAKPGSTGRTLPLGWDDPASAPAPGPVGPFGPDDSSPAGGSPTDADHPAPGPASSRRRPRLALAGAIAAVLALVLVLPGLLVGGDGPEQLVRAHLDALVAGDVDTVREHLDTSPEASDAALTSAILLAAAERVTGYTIENVVTTGRQATVTATLRLGDTSQEAAFTARSESTGPFSRAEWTLDPVPSAVYAVTIPERAEELLVNGVPLPVAELPARTDSYGQQVVALRLLPGTHALELSGAGELLDPVVEILEVPVPGAPVQRAGAVMGYDLSIEGWSRIVSEVEARVQDCSESTSSAPAGCPFSAAEPTWEVGAPAAGQAPEATWEVAPSGQYRIERVIGETWRFESEPARAVFTPAADEADRAPRQVVFVVRGTVVVDPSGDMQITTERTDWMVLCPEDGSDVTLHAPDGALTVGCPGGD